MKFSTTFNFAERKGIVKKIEELVNPCANSLDVRAEISFEISVDELKELYRDRNEVDASNTDVSNFLSQIGKIWSALKNGIHDLLGEIIGAEDKVYDVQNCILRIRKNAYENKVEMTKFKKRTDKEAAEELKDAEEKTED
jgi:hypothetical protein